MKKIDSFINQYSLNKTLRFKLIPYGATERNFYEHVYLERDKERAQLYKNVKKYIDEYHKYFMDISLSGIKHLDISDYAELYYKSNKNDSDKDQMKKEADKYRKYISKVLTSHSDYKKLFDKRIITEVLPFWLKDTKQIKEVEEFSSFSTYFRGFHENRKNMYSDEEKSTGIAYRCINDNLPKFLDNVKAFEKIVEGLGADKISELNEHFEGLTGSPIQKFFDIDSFAAVLSQKGIAFYNNIIGGYTLSTGEKVQGINEFVNLYNQTHEKAERLPKLKMLFKQILSEREAISFIPEKYEDDDEVIKSIYDFYTDVALGVLEGLSNLFAEFDKFSSGGIFVKNGVAITEISNKLLGSWSVIKSAWETEYDIANLKNKKITEKYLETRSKKWKANESFSISELEHFVGENTVSAYYIDGFNARIKAIEDNYSLTVSLLSKPYDDKNKRLAKNDGDIALIKNLLDSMKELEWFLKPLHGSGKEENKELEFYAEFDKYMLDFSELDRLYDKVRNYVTQKPYSKDKVKLNFENPQFLDGWDRNKERDYRTVLLRKNDNYYLGIMAKNASKTFLDYPCDNSNGWEKIDYKLLPGPSKMLPKVFFAASNIGYYNPSDEILRIRSTESFKKGENFSINDCHKLIQFYQDSISRHPDWCEYGFKFKNANAYLDISGFYRDVEQQGYLIKYKSIAENYIEEKINNGELYLFQIYNKDFSPYSKGTPNLHTLYFKMLFDERNLEDVVYQLNGGAEMFYRFPSIKNDEIIVHPKGLPINNKNLNIDKKTSTFEYDLIKDKRYTKPQFSLHLPITLNFKAIGNERINESVRRVIKNSESNYVIGIDRGERHLVYITVIDNNGGIVEQFSGNEIINEYKGKEYKVDYHALLGKKEEERLQARQDWGTIENIKDLKEGYISQIVHKVCELVVKYDAIIAMEDLNSGFKNSRTKVEKSVYQKFEKMLIDKLNYLADKKKSPEENGGILRAYQLCEKFESFKRMTIQNGFIFYVPAWLTSKIDPTTGFVDLLKPKYNTETESKEFIGKFDSIVYNKDENIFEFSFDYKNFPKGTTDFRGKWTVCSYGSRIETKRDEAANGNFVSNTVVITDEWKRLFGSVGIDYENGSLKEQILTQNGKAFYSEFMHLLRLTLQMRNSITGSEEDYLISPVRGADGRFYDSREHDDTSKLPSNADANGAYNIARKALWAIEVLKDTPDEKLKEVKLSITNKDWLAFAQSHE